MIRSLSLPLAAFLASACFTAPASAAVFTWNGGGGATNQWSNGANWVGGVAPDAVTVNDVVFSAATSTPAVNDITGLSLGQISFTAAETQLFSISGSSVNLFTGLSDASASTQTVSFSTIGLGAGQSWFAAAGSTMVVTSAVNGNGNLLELGLGGAGGNLIISGVISSTSNVVITGPGMTLLSGNNVYTGSTTVDGGFLAINSDSNLGAGAFTSTVAVINGGTIQAPRGWTSFRYISLSSATPANFDTLGKTITLFGSISGPGSLVEVGTGTIVLAGTNFYAGGTTISSGTISISTDSNLGAATGALTISNGGQLITTSRVTSGRAITLGGIGGTINTPSGVSSLFSGAIGGGGALTKAGTGSLTLSGANTFTGGLVMDGGTLVLSGGAANAYAGGTTVNAGTVQLGADDSLPLNGAVTLANGTTFDLNGFNQNQSLGAVVNNGTINVRAGNLTLNNGYSGTGTMVVALAAAVTNVNGANIDTTGGSLNVSLVNPIVANGDTFTPISGQIGTCYAQAQISSPAALQFAPSCAGGVVTLTVAFVPFANVATTPNQTVVANMLEPLRTAPTGDLINVFSAINTLNTLQLQNAFDAIGPISLGAMKGLGQDGSTVQSAAVSQRLAVLAKGGDASGIASYTVHGHTSYPGVLVASAIDDLGSPAPVVMKEPASPWGFFSSIVGTDGHVDPTSSAGGVQPGYHTNLVGLSAGGDYRFASNLAVGLAGAFLTGQAGIDSPGSGTISDHTARLGVYGTVFEERWRANAYVGGAKDYFQTNRNIQFGGLSRTATASPRGDEINVYLGGSGDVYSGELGALGPFVGLNYDRLHIGGFTEDGAASLNLRVSAQTSQSLRSSLGIKWSPVLGPTVPYLSAGWRHEFMNQSRPIEAQLASGASSVFTVNTGAIAQDGALIGAGVAATLNANWGVKADYTGDIRSGFAESAFNASARYRF